MALAFIRVLPIRVYTFFPSEVFGKDVVPDKATSCTVNKKEITQRILKTLCISVFSLCLSVFLLFSSGWSRLGKHHHKSGVNPTHRVTTLLR